MEDSVGSHMHATMTNYQGSEDSSTRRTFHTPYKAPAKQ